MNNMSRNLLLVLMIVVSEASQLDKLIHYARGNGPNPGIEGSSRVSAAPMHVPPPRHIAPVPRARLVAPKHTAPVPRARLVAPKHTAPVARARLVTPKHTAAPVTRSRLVAPKHTAPVARARLVAPKHTAAPVTRSRLVAPKHVAPIRISGLPAGAVQISGGRNHATRILSDRTIRPTRRLVSAPTTSCRDCAPRSRPAGPFRAIKVPSRVQDSRARARTPIRVKSLTQAPKPIHPSHDLSRQGRKFKSSVFNRENNHRNNQNSREQEFSKTLRGQKERKGRTHLGPLHPHPLRTEADHANALNQHLQELQKVLLLQQPQLIQQQQPQQIFQQPQQLFQQPQQLFQKSQDGNNAYAISLQKHQENVEATLVQQQLHQLPQHQQLVQQQQLLQQQPQNHFQQTPQTNAAHHQALQQHLQGVAKVLAQQQQQQHPQQQQHHVLPVQHPGSPFAVPGLAQHQQYAAQLQAAQQALLSLG